MTCDEAIRHDWFKDLLIQTEKDIENRIDEINREQCLALSIEKQSKKHLSEFLLSHVDEYSPENVF